VHRNIDSGQRICNHIAPHLSKSLTVRIEVAPGLPPVHASGGELNPVWLNLLDNALEAFGLGGHVTVTAKPEGARWWSGSGRRRGHAPEHVQRIFDPFFTTNGPGEGTGWAGRSRGRASGSTAATSSSNRDPAVPSSASCCRCPARAQHL
jgi:signal transduction histidine kinase